MVFHSYLPYLLEYFEKTFLISKRKDIFCECRSRPNNVAISTRKQVPTTQCGARPEILIKAKCATSLKKYSFANLEIKKHGTLIGKAGARFWTENFFISASEMPAFATHGAFTKYASFVFFQLGKGIMCLYSRESIIFLKWMKGCVFSWN